MGKQNDAERIAKSYRLARGFAACDDCEWYTNEGRNAQAVAAIHARRFGHKVRGVVESEFIYNGRGKEVTR